jgi:enoyl-CoA hydratase/carnithine racemase
MNEIIVFRPEPGIASLRINRPEVRNALNQNVRQQLAEHFTTLGQDADIRCIILTGGEHFFAAGSELRDIADCTPIDLYPRQVERLWQAIAGCPKPVIAAVNGYAWGGGCELAMHADIIVAGENASFAQPEIKVGIMPGAGGTQRLTRAGAGKDDRRDAAAGRGPDQGSAAGRARRIARHRADARTESVSPAVRQRRPEGRHARLF